VWIKLVKGSQVMSVTQLMIKFSKCQEGVKSPVWAHAAVDAESAPVPWFCLLENFHFPFQISLLEIAICFSLFVVENKQKWENHQCHTVTNATGWTRVCKEAAV